MAGASKGAIGGLVLALAGLAPACGDDGEGMAWEPTTTADGGSESLDDGSSSVEDGGTAGECSPGEVQPCLCPDGLSLGEQLCADDASGFYPCECAGEDTDASTGDPMPPLPAEVCYLGADEAGTTCLPLVAFYADLPMGYEYPVPMQGDGQDRPPLGLIDVQAASGSLAMAPNFQLSELAQPGNGQWAVIQPHAVESLQTMRDQAGAIAVVTGYLSPAANAAAGGDLYARHQYGDGFDLDPLDTTLGVLSGLCMDEGGTAVEFETHIHCELSAVPLDEGFFGPPPGASPPGEQLRSLDAWIEPDGHRYWAPARGFDEGEPRRVWTARDAAGRVLVTEEGRDFEAPAGAVEVEVLVGGHVRRTRAIP